MELPNAMDVLSGMRILSLARLGRAETTAASEATSIPLGASPLSTSALIVSS